MGFLDKAKKLAEQAQEKLDEVQSQFNQQQPAPTGPVTEYDKHGRPIGSTPPPTPGVPPTGSAAEPPVEAPPAAPAPPATPASATVTSAQREADPPVGDDRNFPSHAPPTLTSGDPLAG